MHIGFDISQTGPKKAGCGYFAYAMAEALLKLAPEHDFSLYPSFGNFFFDPRMPIASPFSGQGVSYGPRHLTRESANSFWINGAIERELNFPDIIHSNNFWTPVQLNNSRLVYTLYDLGFIINPAWTTESNRVGCFDGVFRSSVVADFVVAISEYSRREYLRFFPDFPEDRIEVIYPSSRFFDVHGRGVAPPALREANVGDFWLCVGTIEPRKNQLFLAQAYAQYLAMGGKKFPLVFAGGEGWLMNDFEKRINELDIRDSVVILGYVSDDELIWLYRNCYANLYPSIFEGFGLPVLEGMQFGAPTVSSDATSMPEIAGNEAILISPNAPDQWVRTMLELSSIEGMREQLSNAGKKRAQVFDWKHSASSLLKIYEQTLKLPKRPLDALHV